VRLVSVSDAFLGLHLGHREEVVNQRLPRVERLQLQASECVNEGLVHGALSVVDGRDISILTLINPDFQYRIKTDHHLMLGNGGLQFSALTADIHIM
jgi:hypothetical protein